MLVKEKGLRRDKQRVKPIENPFRDVKVSVVPRLSQTFHPQPLKDLFFRKYHSKPLSDSNTFPEYVYVYSNKFFVFLEKRAILLRHLKWLFQYGIKLIL